MIIVALEMYVYTPMMRNFGFDNRVHWPTRRPSFKICLFVWEWILIGYEDLSIDFGRTILMQDRDLASKIRLRSLLEPAISEQH